MVFPVGSLTRLTPLPASPRPWPCSRVPWRCLTSWVSTRSSWPTDGITDTLRHADATPDTVQARWLIGCDGAHSAVRKAVGLPFEGTRYEESFLLAYVRIEERAPVDEARAFFTPDGPVGLLPLPLGRHYLIIPLLKETAETDRTTVSLDELKTLLAQRGMASLRILEAFWITKFRVHRRIAPS